MPEIVLPQGTITYRVAGPDEATAPPVVFVHGFLVDGELWRGVADHLAAHGVRSYAPTWPLGSHTRAMAPGTDQTPRGVARTILAFLEALGLEDVTLVANDSGGAITQFLLDTDTSRVGRVVFTNCDAFEKFPPFPFDVIFGQGGRPRVLRAILTPMRARALRHSPLGFGLLVRRPLDAALTRRWVAPCLQDDEILRDTSAFVGAVDKAELLDVSTRLHRVDVPALLVWGAADRFFTIALARRLRDTLPDARLVEVPGGRTFLPLDEPELVARHVAEFAGATRRPAPTAAPTRG